MINLWKETQEMYKKLVEITINGDCTTRKLLNYLCHQKYYKLIVIDSSTQKNTNILQKVNFVEKLEKDNGANIFFITEKQQNTILNFSLPSFNVTEQYKQWNIEKYWLYLMKQAILNLWPENGTLARINHDAWNEIIHQTKVLKSNLCGYNDAYIIVTEDITVVWRPTTQVALKTCAPSIDCITKIDGTIYDAEDLDLAMAM